MKIKIRCNLAVIGGAPEYFLFSSMVMYCRSKCDHVLIKCGSCLKNNTYYYDYSEIC